MYHHSLTLSFPVPSLLSTHMHFLFPNSFLPFHFLPFHRLLPVPCIPLSLCPLSTFSYPVNILFFSTSQSSLLVISVYLIFAPISSFLFFTFFSLSSLALSFHLFPHFITNLILSVLHFSSRVTSLSRPFDKCHVKSFY